MSRHKIDPVICKIPIYILGAPGIAIPMALGGTVQQLMAPSPAPLDIKPASGTNRKYT